MKSSVIAGLAVVAGAALVIEAALIPGLLIGAVVVLAPKPGRGARARRKLIRKQRVPAPARAPKHAARDGSDTPVLAAQAEGPAPFNVKEAVYKTITFRMIATSFDFTANMIVIGNFTTAASLSAFGLVGAPLFYLGHELFWNRIAPPGAAVDVGALLDKKAPLRILGLRGVTMNRALAKTITYEIVATTVDFSANFVATGSVLTAAGLTSFALVLGPILYYGHEKIWDYFKSEDRLPGEGQPLLIAAPA